MGLTVACVKTGTKYDSDYVLRLKNGVDRYMPENVDYDFVCFTNEPVDGIECRPIPEELPGWWAKLYLFSLGKPLLFLDLDVVVVGDLKPLIEWDGFGILRDPINNGFNSSVMKLTGNEGHIWSAFAPNVMTMLPGDQDWINIKMANVKTFPREWVPSYKVDKCFANVPNGAIIINFHGFPKPRQCGGWVQEYWI